MAKSGEATKKSKKIGRQIGRPRGAKNRIRSVPSKASVLKSIWQRAERAKDTPLYIELVKLFEKVRLADRPPRPRGTQPDSQKGRRDAQQQAKSDAKAAARAAFGKGLAVPELSTHLSPSTASDSAQSAQQAIPAQPESDAAAKKQSRQKSVEYLAACGVLHVEKAAIPVQPICIDATPPPAPNENTDTRPPIQPSPAKASPIVGVWTPEMLALRDRARK
jgi:hypothetical protein